MLTDNEIKRVTEDALGFKAWAQTLEEIICSSETPITVGVYGKWGSGKTSLMRMTEDLLKGRDVVKTVWFDAWKFDKTHDLRVALIDAVLRRIQNDESINESLKMEVGNLLKRVNWLGLGKVAISSLLPLPSLASHVVDSLMESFLKNPEDIPEKTLQLIGEFEGEFRGIIEEYIGENGRLVVFIDDLDRCIPEKAIDVLESIKLFLHVKGSVFIIGADKKVIEDGIIQKYGRKSENWGRSYLDKIIQIPVNLPPLRKDIIAERFISELDIHKEIKRYADIIAEVGDNPRMIKRLLNRFEIQRILAEKKKLTVENKVMAKLVVIEFRWPEFYIDLISVYSETGTNLIQILKEISECADTEREDKLKEWEFLKKYFGDKGLMKFLLEKKPLLADIDLDHYVYMGLNTTELIKSAENYFNIAYSAYEKGDYDKAIENYDKATDLNPKNEKAWFNKGIAYEKLEDLEATYCYETVTDLNPKNEKAWFNRGRILLEHWLEEGGFLPVEEVMECFDKATELNPKNEEAWFNRGRMFDIEGEISHEYAEISEELYDEVPPPEEEIVEYYKKAIKCYGKAINLNPKHENAWFEMGTTHERLEEYDEATRCFHEVTKLIPKNEEEWLYMGRRYEIAWYNMGQRYGTPTLNEATKCTERVLELNPKNEKAWLNKGRILKKIAEITEGSGKEVPTLNEAMECIGKVLELNPENREAWEIKGNLLEKLGQKKEAKKCFERAKALD